MFAASIVEKMSPGPRRRPATKKSVVPETRRPIQRPRPTRSAEYPSRRPSWSDIDRALLWQIARGGHAGGAGRLAHGADDGGGDGVGGERSDGRHLGGPVPATGREREHGVAVS